MRRTTALSLGQAGKAQIPVETHRDPHRDFRKLNRDEQQEYWKWRHDRPDRR
ncbi:MAG TPA: hypothetical protein VN841_18145 [Bryobacteraceae bacterium]|nr:hypothetical protein [Bryobacteraceae bacterium]